ncbi:MAG: hypothetical protein CHACPFDD_01249 [Phycisphaerae bacterium]|nr:hypothetical protein [Phycisphaerae bacterium]
MPCDDTRNPVGHGVNRGAKRVADNGPTHLPAARQLVDLDESVIKSVRPKRGAIRSQPVEPRTVDADTANALANPHVAIGAQQWIIASVVAIWYAIRAVAKDVANCNSIYTSAQTAQINTKQLLRIACCVTHICKLVTRTIEFKRNQARFTATSRLARRAAPSQGVATVVRRLANGKPDRSIRPGAVENKHRGGLWTNPGIVARAIYLVYGLRTE